jgi:NAD(P)-dependent dehydrogenase (short-subunit alcohol dehydrogenase family)
MAGLNGKVALISGGTRGIGRSIALALKAEGVFVYALGRNQRSLEEIQTELGKQGTAIHCDVREAQDTLAARNQINKTHGRIDFLINNAGVAHENMPVQELPFALFKNVVDTNLHGLFLTTQAALPLIPDGGAIVINLSVAAMRVFPGASGYCSSKFGALGLTNTLREELRSRRIRVTGLVPGPIETDIWNQFWAEAPREKMAKPEDVAQVVLDILKLPESATVEFAHIGPTGGELG